MKQLNNQNLSLLSNDVEIPKYDRSQLKAGIMHFGVGGFHRAHQAMYGDALMNNGLALDWAICGVGVMPFDKKMRDVLSTQDGLYTLIVKYPNGDYKARVIGSIIDFMYAPDDPEKVIERLASPETRIVSLTITEGGYNFHHVTGEFDFEQPAIAQDLNNSMPQTVFGLITEALHRRRARNIAPFTIMSCDNIQGNGDVAKKMFVAYAERKYPSFGTWIKAQVCFPNSMVDRITPVTTDEDIAQLAAQFGIKDAWPVVCEPFTQWVLEDDFNLGRPEWEQASTLDMPGAQLVKDVEPYELMKLRLLNASHQALTYLGYLSGYRYAHEVCQDPLFSEFLLNFMNEESTPTLQPVPGIDLNHYKRTLIERFSNAEIKDTLARLCAESSDRIPKWLLPIIRKQLDSQGEIRRSVAVVASWARYAEGKDEQGNSINVVDRLKDDLVARAAHNYQNILSFIENRQVFGDLVDNTHFRKIYSEALAHLHENGARATVEYYL